MAKNDCIAKILKSGKYPTVSQDQLRSFAEDMEELIKVSGDNNLNVAEVIEDFLRTRREDIEMTKAQALLTKEKYDTLVDYVNQAGFKGDKHKAILSLMDSNFDYNYRGMPTVYSRQRVIADDISSIITQNFDQFPGMEKRYFSGELDQDIYRILHEGKTVKDPHATEMARRIKAANEYIYKTKVDAGFNVGYIKNYVRSQVHNTEKMVEMGPDNWGQLARETFDFERMGVAADKIDERLEGIYDMLIKRANRLGYGEVDDPFEAVIKYRAGKRFERGRKIFFKTDGDSAYKYAKAMGERTFAEDYFRSLDRQTGSIAAAQVFGPNYDASLQKLMKVSKESIEPGSEKLRKFTNEQQRIFREFDYLTKGPEYGEITGLARIFDKSRKLTDMVKLHQALVTTITDFAFGAAAIKGATGKSYFSSLKELAFDFPKTFLSKSEMRKYSAKMEMLTTDTIVQFQQGRFGEKGKISDGFDKLHHYWMRATGLPHQAVSMKTALARQFGVAFAELKGTNFKDLYLGTRQVFEKFGIDEEGWNAIRKSTEMFEGSEIISPDKIRQLGANPELAIRYKAMIRDLVEVGSPTPTLAVAAYKNAWPKHTAMGQVILFAAQYKSFAISMFRTMNAIRKMGDTGKYGRFGNIENLALTMMTSTGLGYLALLAKDGMSGRNPRNPFELKTMTEAMAQSGSMLIYFDFLSADYNKAYRSLPADLVGPVIGGLGNDLFQVLHSYRKAGFGEKDASMEKAFRQSLIAIERNTPSLFFSRALVNKYFYDNLHRAANTGRRRKETWWYDE